MNLKILCNEVFDNRDYYKWDYYNCLNDYTFEDIWHNPECFIKQMFDRGGKSEFWKDISLSTRRYKHMMVAFFLGHYISKNFSIFDNLNNDGSFFPWAWFLCCLYHDAYSDSERKMKGRRYHKDYSDYRRYYFDKPNHALYGLNIINGYDNYRFKYCNKKRDHGIYAADRLAKSYNRIFNQFNLRQVFLANNLYIDEELCDRVNHIAQVIACHNLFLCQNKDDEYMYDACGLQELIPTQNCSCKMPKFLNYYGQMYFLLCLCDNIEPTKRGIDLAVLHIDVNNGIEIKLPNDNITHYYYAKTQFELNSWLNYIKVSVENKDNKYTIKYEINKNEQSTEN